MIHNIQIISKYKQHLLH